ncbi:RNA polymerase II C-terminal domain phosphatase-like 4 [Citrus sinensis]|nr:RNA polymerase II C-terminal domain phosphatase-like 4 [Citrus sinensis]
MFRKNLNLITFPGFRLELNSVTELDWRLVSLLSLAFVLPKSTAKEAKSIKPSRVSQLSRHAVRQMSVATDSPVHSPSSDDFAALLDAELDSNSLRLSPDKEADDEDDDKETKRHKRQIVEIILEHQGSTSLGIFEEKTDMLYCAEVSLEMDNCLHPGSLGGMCCGKRLEEECGVTFSYAYKGLRVGNDKIDRLRNTDMKHLLRHRKLYLILELDHTLLNWTLLLHLTPEEDYLKSQVESLQGTENGQREVLKGCKLVFSHAFPSKFPAHIHYLWKVVEQLGATCSIELDPSVTHVVSNKCSNEKVSLGSKGGQVFGGSTVDRGSQLFVARATRREVSCEANQT